MIFTRPPPFGLWASRVKGAADDPLIPLIGFGRPNFDQIAVMPSNPQPAADAARAGSNTEMKALFTRYGADFAISPQDLKLTVAPDGKRQGEIETKLVAYHREGNILNIVKRKSGLALEPKVRYSKQSKRWVYNFTKRPTSR